MSKALVALALSTFSIGTTEFVVSGLLPNISKNLGVTVPTAGLLVTGYALGIVVGAPAMTIALRRRPPKQVLIALMVLFILGSVVSALAPSYAVLMVGRLLCAIAHGGFFAIGASMATRVVPPERQASAVALMFVGLTVANVAGVPIGTLVGQQFGWRAAFVVVAAAASASLVALVWLVPREDAPASEPLSQTVAPFRNKAVWLSVGVTAFGLSGMFAAFTYVVPLMTGVGGWSSAAVTWLLVAFGAGVTAGNLLGGRLADWRLDTTICIALVLLAATLFVFAVVAHSKVGSLAALVALGVTGFAPNSPMQNRLIRLAPCEPTIGSAANIAAVNIGSALGAWLGGVVVTAGLGYTAVTVVGGLMTTFSVVLFVVLITVGGGRTSSPANTSERVPARPQHTTGGIDATA